MVKGLSDFIRKAREERREFLYEYEAKEVLRYAGLCTTKQIVSKNVEEAVKAAEEIGYPIVLKIASPQVLHKSEAGGVLLNIKDSEGVRSGYTRILNNVKSKLPEAEIKGVLVQEMAPESTEVIIGAARDTQFGPTVMFGVGGIFTEVIKDVSFRVAPITVKEANEMIGEIKASKILEGVRGLPKADIQAISTIIVKVSELMLDHPDIEAIDLNPVLIYEDGAVIVDARFVLEEKKKPVREHPPVGELKPLLDPSSVAVIGASTNPEKIGHKILRNIVDAGFKGKVYPINPRGGEILGLKAYQSVLDIPGEVEMAVVIVPANLVPSVIEECTRKGVKGAVIISSGFRDVGPNGAELEKQFLDMARKGNLRIIGPNCQGVSNPRNGFCATWPIVDAVGNVAIISQSGSIALEIPTFLAANHSGYSKSIALGNKADVDEADLISLLAEDGETEVIAVYTEGMEDGRRLMEAIRKASSSKPVLVLKGGKTEAGRRAVLAHTGAMAGSREVFEAAVKQSGGLCREDLEELCDAAKTFSTLNIPKGNRLLVVTSSGGAGILSSDACEEAGLALAKVSESTIERLKEALPDYCILSNPLDLTGNAYSNPSMYRDALDIIIEDRGVDMILVVFGDPIPDAYDVICEQVKKAREYKIPLVANYIGGADIQEAEIDGLQKRGVPVFPTPKRAIRALSQLWNYHKQVTRLNGG